VVHFRNNFEWCWEIKRMMHTADSFGLGRQGGNFLSFFIGLLKFSDEDHEVIVMESIYQLTACTSYLSKSDGFGCRKKFSYSYFT